MPETFKIERKSHNLHLTVLSGFVKVMLVLPQDIYSDIVSESYNTDDRFAFERSKINWYIQNIFKTNNPLIFKWTNEASFKQFLLLRGFQDNSQFWFKTVYIKFGEERPFVQQYTIHSYVSDLSGSFEYMFLHKDILHKDIFDIRQLIIRNDNELLKGRLDSSFIYKDYEFSILKNYQDAIGLELCYRPRGMIFTETFFEKFLKDKNTNLVMVKENSIYDQISRMLKIPLNNFNAHFKAIKEAVNYDLQNGKIGEKLYWEYRHHEINM